MSYYLTELYSAKPAWLALPDAARHAFFATIGEGMPPLMALGIEPIAMGKIDPSPLHSAPHQFFAIWRLPDAAALATLLNGIAATGWHEYFDTINAAGQTTDFAGHLTQLAGV